MTGRPENAEFDFHRIRWIFYGLTIGMFTASISQTIVGPAIPRIVAELGGLQFYAWLSTIVMLVSAVVTPISGKLADMFGRRRFYILGLSIFMLGSALSGAAFSFEWLIASRAVQGVGMGILMPLSQTILGDIIPPRQRGKYQGYMGAMMGASQVAGPLIGGAITDISSWRWLFYINLPIGALALFFIVKFLRVPELSIPRKVDHAGIATMTIGVTSLLLGISFGGTHGWLDPLVVILLTIGTAFLVAFIFVEQRAAEPIVPMHLFKNSIFTWAVLGAFFLSMSFMIVVIYTPVYAQGVIGVTATTSGLILMPMNLAFIGVGVIVGFLTTRTGRYKVFAVGGSAVMLIAGLTMMRLGLHSTELILTGMTMLFGVGFGMSLQIYTLAVQNAVQRRDLGPATAALQFFRNIGNTIATAVAGTMMTQQIMVSFRAHITPEMSLLVLPGEINANAVLDPEASAKLPEPIVALLRLALSEAMHAVYQLVPLLAAFALLSTLMMRAIPLRDSLSVGEDRGRELLDSTAMSHSNPEMVLLTPAEYQERSRERMLAAHLLLLSEQVEQRGNELLRSMVTEYGGGDLDRGLQILRSTGTMLLSEDPSIIDEHEAFAVELSERGKKKNLVSAELNTRMNEVARRVAEAPKNAPTKPVIRSSEGIDASALNRAVSMLNTALVADIAVRRWDLDEGDDELFHTAAEDA